MQYELFVSCPKGLEYLLEEEVKALGLIVTRVSPQGVYGQGSLAIIYHLCLWSRLANRVQLILFTALAGSEPLISKVSREFPWQTIFSVDCSFAVSFHGRNPSIRNTMYGAQLIKDGVVDYFRKTQGKRPSVDKMMPEVQLHAYLQGEELTVSFDLSGGSLHQRGYRVRGGEAPIKENVAAALLIRARWPELVEQGFAFHDPFCGSGTLVIEAALMAARFPPARLRPSFGFVHWQGYEPILWDKIKHEAVHQTRAVNVSILGSDMNASSILQARQHAERAGVSDWVRFEKKSISDCRAPAPKGVLVCNPPYGERLGQLATLLPFYQSLGKVLHEQYSDWKAAVLTDNPELAKATGLRSNKQYAIYNGALACHLYLFQVTQDNLLKSSQSYVSAESITMLINRLKKNETHLLKWAKRIDVNAYRLFDADIPEYAFAVDRYQEYIVLQEYLPPKSIPPALAERRRLEMSQAVLQAFSLPVDKLIIKQRQAQKGITQYEKLDQKHEMIQIQEGKAVFLVNLRDYLDTGVFLDHRPLRRVFSQLPKSTRFLNLFSYTATASVQAALAGAFTTNVDLSNTYTHWAEQNFRANHLALSQHRFVHMDVRKWLLLEQQKSDVIFLDPPTFSNSKRMEENLDIQRDHVSLIEGAMKHLTEQGELYFSTNLRRFKLSPELSSCYQVVDITAKTIDEDFKRRPKIHWCFKITK